MRSSSLLLEAAIVARASKALELFVDSFSVSAEVSVRPLPMPTWSIMSCSRACELTKRFGGEVSMLILASGGSEPGTVDCLYFRGEGEDEDEDEDESEGGGNAGFVGGVVGAILHLQLV